MSMEVQVFQPQAGGVTFGGEIISLDFMGIKIMY